jgi:hypothetical protein
MLPMAIRIDPNNSIAVGSDDGAHDVCMIEVANSFFDGGESGLEVLLETNVSDPARPKLSREVSKNCAGSSWFRRPAKGMLSPPWYLYSEKSDSGLAKGEIRRSIGDAMIPPEEFEPMLESEQSDVAHVPGRTISLSIQSALVVKGLDRAAWFGAVFASVSTEHIVIIAKTRVKVKSGLRIVFSSASQFSGLRLSGRAARDYKTDYTNSW